MCSFNNEGSLVANAPHVPVHLGSMSEAIKTVVRLNKDNIYPDDVFVLNAHLMVEHIFQM